MKKIILGLALLGSLAFGITFSKEQVKQFEQNCEAGIIGACGLAGLFYQLPTEHGGNASDRDYKKTAYFYKKACDGNVYMICSDLGAIYEDGEGIKKTIKRLSNYIIKLATAGLQTAAAI